MNTYVLAAATAARKKKKKDASIVLPLTEYQENAAMQFKGRTLQMVLVNDKVQLKLKTGKYLTYNTPTARLAYASLEMYSMGMDDEHMEILTRRISRMAYRLMVTIDELKDEKDAALAMSFLMRA